MNEIDPFIKIDEIIGNPKKSLKALIPVSRSTWYAGIKAGIYPPGVKIGQRRIAWRYSHIAALLKRLGGEA